MSLAAALKKGLETADSIGNWDPFGDEGGAAPTGPANTNASARALAKRPDGAAAKRNPISAVRDGVAEASPKAQPQARAAQPARPAHKQAAQKQVAQRVVAQKPQAGRQPAPQQQPSRRANWLHDAVPGGRVNAAQYVRELDRFAAEENRRAVADVVMEVNQGEVEGVVRHAARIKGRYLAKLLDIGNKAKSGVMEAEITELTRYREGYEELARGLEILKTAIEAGDIAVSGTVRR